MKYIIDEMYAFRFYEKKDGPFVSIRQFSYDEVSKLGQKGGMCNIHDIYNNRVLIEDLLLRQFIRKGGVSDREYPYYATVFDKLPDNNQLHVRFQEPECLKIPMKEFPKEKVSFTYGQSPRALTRKDNHPTRRKVLLWDEAEWAINQFPFVKDEGTWLEMQIWEDDTLKRFYKDGKGENISLFVVEDRLSQKQREQLIANYASEFDILRSNLFFAPTSAHGLAHAKRVMVLADVLAERCGMSVQDRLILKYAAAFHDIGRQNHKEDEEHGKESYKSMEAERLIPQSFQKNEKKILQFVVEAHPIKYESACRLSTYNGIEDKKRAMNLLSIMKDADTLDRCRFGNVDINYLINEEAKALVNFGYQLLVIYPEVFI